VESVACPAGVDLWYFDLRSKIGAVSNPLFDPKMRVPTYRGQPDSPFSAAEQNELFVGALGGGDIDTATGFGAFTGVGRPVSRRLLIRV